MNRGFKYYYKEGLKYSSQTLKGKGNLLRVILFMMVTAFSVVCPLLLPVVSMAYFRLARQVKYEQNIEVCKLFKACDNPKNYWTVILVDLMKGLLYIAMIFMLALLACFTALLGGGIYLLSAGASELILYAFMIPAAILLVVFILIYPYATVPSAFIVDNNDGINPTKALFDSVHALNKTGKRTYFATYLVESLITMGILAVGIIVSFLPYLLMQDFFGLGLTIILFLISMYFVVKLVVKYNLAFAVARYSLFEDLTTDKYKAGQRVEGVAVKGLESMTVQEKLEALFEEDANVKRFEELLNETNELTVVQVTSNNPVSQSVEDQISLVEESVVQEGPVEESASVTENPIVLDGPTEEIKSVVEEVSEELTVEESTEEPVIVSEPASEETPEESIEVPGEVAVVEEQEEQESVEETAVEEVAAVEEPIDEPVIKAVSDESIEVPAIEEVSEEPMTEEVVVVEEQEEPTIEEEPVILEEEPEVVEDPITKKRKSTKAVK